MSSKPSSNACHRIPVNDRRTVETFNFDHISVYGFYISLEQNSRKSTHPWLYLILL
ncbi:hypothetical protein DFQ00_10445 [Paenibacillus barcinonensis]|uniref:Uncharacterized protein n=1 Tax=Paenibacillus barcinonensis TaxID=198119 RepID=A0A2V4W5H9_PAEBA|nr:hypothetical protein DFQ00_10445 [Paenibacillus barcinonensis]